jgi:hypothetical protein
MGYTVKVVEDKAYTGYNDYVFKEIFKVTGVRHLPRIDETLVINGIRYFVVNIEHITKYEKHTSWSTVVTKDIQVWALELNEEE